MVSMRSGSSICAPPRLSGVSPMLPLKQFQCWSDSWRWPFLDLSRKMVERFLFLRLSLFQAIDSVMSLLCQSVPAGSVSSSSILQIFREATRLCWLLFQPVYLLCHFLWLRHVQSISLCPKVETKLWRSNSHNKWISAWTVYEKHKSENGANEKV